jgi:thioredoxin reductase
MAVDTPARIAVLGAGPIGIETALYARFLGYDVDLYERGRVCQNMLDWGHVRLFSPWAAIRSNLGLAALGAQGAADGLPADNARLTGRELVEAYYAPLAASDLLVDGLREQTEVLAVGRQGLLKGDAIGDESRGEHPFRLLIRGVDGEENRQADVVIDTTGTYGAANSLGQGGIPAVGEKDCAPFIERHIPDVLERDRATYAGKHTLVIGGGYSAATTIVDLAQLASDTLQTEIAWATRTPAPEPITRIADDRLPERDRLAHQANRLAAEGGVRHLPGALVERLRRTPDGTRVRVTFAGDDATELEFDRIVSLVGYRPDARIYSELQVHQCYASDGPMKLAAALLEAASGDCLDQPSTGPQALICPEPNFYVLGAKSFGRNSKFLIATGLDQVRDLFTIIGDRAGLDLYSSIKSLA